MAPKSGISRFAGKHQKVGFWRVMDLLNPLGLPAAVQGRFLGWGNGFNRGFLVATGAFIHVALVVGLILLVLHFMRRSPASV
jgi:hypothetical protein